MCDNDSKETKNLQALEQILEDAINAGADAVELEYVDSGLEICFMSGNIGWGSVLTDRELIGEVIKAVVEKAGLERKSHGKMQIELFGKQHTIIVEEWDSFGESAFRLILETPMQNRT